MNSRIYLQPDALPTQEMIKTANRLFRHFGKEVTFLQQPVELDAAAKFADITMNRLRWALSNLTELSKNPEAEFARLSEKAGNVVVDLVDFAGDAAAVVAAVKTAFEADDQVANLVVITPPEEVEMLAKEDQAAAKRK